MSEEVKLMKGNEAIAHAAIRCGCDGYFGYPITPQSEVLETLMEVEPWKTTGMVVLQAESEVSAINMVYGGAGCGKKVMTSSSSPGVSLKQEGVSYLAGAELPALIVNVMRGGPGLGTIQPSQADYFQTVKGGGHGDYRLIALAPASVQEMADFVGLGFDLAFKYRNPAIILADGVIGQMMESVRLPEPEDRPYDPEWKMGKRVDGKANIVTSIYLEHNDLEEINRKLQKKYAEVQAAEQLSEELYTEDAELVIVAYGICSRVAAGAIEQLRAEGYKVGMLRPQRVWPFPSDALMKIATNGKCKGFLSVELSAGQMIEDVRLAIECKKPVHLYNRMGGNVPSCDEVVEAAKKVLKEI
jgi:2-oxoglutarate ferredoxin oxidoreductase subunit alpha